MESKTATYFETKVQYNKITEDGLEKCVTEQYVVDAMSFTETEAVITKEFHDAHIKAIKRANFTEVITSKKDADDRYFKAKVQIFYTDEKTKRKKRHNVIYLVQAANIDVARAYMKEYLDSWVCDCELIQLTDTQILDVLSHE